LRAGIDEIHKTKPWPMRTINKNAPVLFHGLQGMEERKDLVNVNPAADVPLRDVARDRRAVSSGADVRRNGLRKVLQQKIDSTDLHPSSLNCASRRFTGSWNSRVPEVRDAQVRAIQPAVGG